MIKNIVRFLMNLHRFEMVKAKSPTLISLPVITPGHSSVCSQH